MTKPQQERTDVFAAAVATGGGVQLQLRGGKSERLCRAAETSFSAKQAVGEISARSSANATALLQSECIRQ